MMKEIKSVKTFVFMRHAKAQKIEIDISDFDRKLTEKGKEDAKIAATTLIKTIPQIDLIISSSAKRTYKTAKIVAEEYGIEKSNIAIFNELYEAELSEYIKVIRNINNEDYKTILIVGHNPTIGAIASVLSNHEIFDFKPGAYAVFQSQLDTFKMFVTAPSKLITSYTP